MLIQTAVERFERELVIRGFRETTCTAYRSGVRHYVDFCTSRELPADSTETVRKHLYHMLEERKLSGSTANVAYTAIKLLFQAGYNRTWDVDPIPRCKTRRNKLPVVVSRSHIETLFKTVENGKHRTVFKTIYSAGLRLGEAVGLKPTDIDSQQMRILIQDAKGGKSRYVMLSRHLLEELREYWRAFRPEVWLFEGERPGTPIHQRTLQRAFKIACEKAGLPQTASLHSLRHSFATHLLEDGTPLPMIQRLLGHSSIKSTMVYLKVQQQAIQVRSPLDSLDLDDPPTST